MPIRVAERMCIKKIMSVIDLIKYTCYCQYNWRYGIEMLVYFVTCGYGSKYEINRHSNGIFICFNRY